MKLKVQVAVVLNAKETASLHRLAAAGVRATSDKPDDKKLVDDFDKLRHQATTILDSSRP